MYSVTSTAGYFISRKLANRSRAVKRGRKPLRIEPGLCVTGKEAYINVSGSRFRIYESYLNQHPETLLGSEERNYFYDEKNKEYFFDRDPCIFKFIHKYYKTGKLHLSDNDCYQAFSDELEFFRIKSQELSPCCSESYTMYLTEKLEKDKKIQTKERKKPQTFRQICWEFTENASFSLAAKIFYYVSCLVIILSVAVSTAETVQCDTSNINGTTISIKCGEAHKTVFFSMDTICVGFFAMEYLLRLYGAPLRLKFVKSKMSIIDLLAILPYFVDLILTSSNAEKNAFAENLLVALRSFRIIRVFKLGRHSKRLRDLSSAVSDSASDLGFIVFMYLNVVIIFASIMFYAENMGNKETKFSNIPQSIWYTVVTTTTLGYGDITPVTVQGKIIGSMCCLMGVLVIALPVPIIQMKSSALDPKDLA